MRGVLAYFFKTCLHNRAVVSRTNARTAHFSAMVSMPTMTDAEPSLTKDAARVIASKDIQNIVSLLSVVEVMAETIMASSADRSCRFRVK